MTLLELIATVVVLWLGFDVALVGLAYLRGLAVRRHEAAQRALRLRLAAIDPARTAGGYVGKSWVECSGFEDQAYMGGCGDQVYPDHTLEPVADMDDLAALIGIERRQLDPYLDHHTLAEYDAIAADRGMEAPHDAATELP